MILALILDGDFAMSEGEDLMDVVLGMGLIPFRLGLMVLTSLIVVLGDAVLIRQTHIDVAGVFAGSSSVQGYSSGPAFAVTGGRPILILQSFVIDVWIGVG